ncbi:uncharacterized protein B0H18DRAFT_617380 [Fomitopsis serialis]|uniref:uncharacterized protein n=1 Tax=Fomitopsis serialis TaxID=139415 RepID=UPI002008BCC4|nr:uncharacterized protein B0H18DRAFT_617380 [Neoantrodia serialis]KAH9920096.1 hypothetical protein B0H18DRAFT_617380 [Neoantrodia serialis]
MERLDDISARLLALGWAPELAFLERTYSERRYDELFSNHRFVCMTTKLTEHGWRRIKGEMTRLMQGVRKQRLDDEAHTVSYKRGMSFESAGKELVEEYLDEHEEMKIFGLNIADLMHTPEVQHLLCAPKDTHVDEQSFLALQAQMETTMEGWKSRACNTLRQLIRRTKRAPKASNVDMLELATTVFRCNCCSPGYLFYPNVLGHKCLRPGPDPLFTFLHGHRYGLFDNMLFLGMFEARNLRFEAALPRTARQIIQVCNKDPDTVTAREMDSLDIRLVRDDVTIMTWRAAVS